MWYFKPKVPGDTIREPIQGEFFATDAISDPGMALVREGIQNSLDAARRGEKVLVRIYVSGDASAADASQARSYFVGAWEHYNAAGSGLRPDEVPAGASSCPFLVFEDFGTTGLEGDPAEPFAPRVRTKNHFYHFFSHRRVVGPLARLQAEGTAAHHVVDRLKRPRGTELQRRAEGIPGRQAQQRAAVPGDRLHLGPRVWLQVAEQVVVFLGPPAPGTNAR